LQDGNLEFRAHEFADGGIFEFRAQRRNLCPFADRAKIRFQNQESHTRSEDNLSHLGLRSLGFLEVVARIHFARSCFWVLGANERNLWL
jgi:hypothetical protein